MGFQWQGRSIPGEPKRAAPAYPGLQTLPKHPLEPGMSKFPAARADSGSRMSPVTASGKGKRWLFLVPHDDDGVIGAGLAMQAALDSGASVSVAVVTDGSAGYCREEDRNSIVEIRREETREAQALLGKVELRFLGFPDGGLFCWRGRRAGEERFDGGLQGAITRLLREIRPDVLAFASSADLHPDHRIVAQELMISLFHATGDIWPELGPKLKPKPGISQGNIPFLLEFPVYCALPELPDWRLSADSEHFERKLEAIAAWRSQKQISALVEQVRSGGSQEFFRTPRFDLYKPREYEALFPSPESPVISPEHSLRIPQNTPQSGIPENPQTDPSEVPEGEGA